MKRLCFVVVVLAACCLVRAAGESSRLDESVRMTRLLGMLGMSSSSRSDVKFGACKPNKPAGNGSPARPATPVPRGLEARIRTRYRTFLDAGPVVIGADSFILDMVDASIKYTNHGKSSSFWLNARVDDSSVVFPEKVPQRCSEGNYAQVMLRVEDAIIVFKEKASAFDPVRGIIGDEIKVENMALEVSVAATAFGTYDEFNSMKVGGPVFDFLDKPLTDPTNGFHFCLGELKISSLKSSSSMAEQLPAFLSWFRPTIESQIGNELKCALRYGQPDIVRIIHEAEHPSEYQLGFEAHTRGGVFVREEEDLSIDLRGTVQVDLPTSPLFSTLARNAKSVLETLKETNTAESTRDIARIEERIRDGETLRQDEYGSFIRAAANNIMFANGMDVASMEAIVDYVVERFIDGKSDFTLSLKKVDLKLQNSVVGSAGPGADFSAGEALINFEGGEGYIPVTLMMAKFAEIRDRERLTRACEVYLSRYQSMVEEKYNELMQECLQFELGDEPLHLDEVKQELAKEKYKMSGDILARIRNWSLSGRLDGDFWDATAKAMCDPEDNGCRENIVVLDDFLSSNDLGLRLSSGDTSGKDGAKGVHASKNIISAHLGLDFFGSIPLPTLLAMGSNWPRFLLDHLSSIHSKRRVARRVQALVNSKLEGMVPAAVRNIMLHRSASFETAISDDELTTPSPLEVGDGDLDTSETNSPHSLYDDTGEFGTHRTVVYEE